jgi:hypothetical protein
MHIAMWVPYDERRIRRTLHFILRPQLKRVRVMGGILAVLGLALLALDHATPFPYVFMVLGLFVVVAIGPLTVARALRLQSNVVKDGFHMTLDNEWVTVSYPLAESRFRWAGLDRVIETPEVWYAMFGRMQAIPIPKETMTQEQRAELAAFLTGLQPAWR